jgi:hypothetical protein
MVDSCPSTSSKAVFPPALYAQRAWDDPCCEVLPDRLLYATTGHVVRARLLAARSPRSGDWLNALPLSNAGLKMDNATVRIAAGLRLGAPIVRSHVFMFYFILLWIRAECTQTPKVDVSLRKSSKGAPACTV